MLCINCPYGLEKEELLFFKTSRFFCTNEYIKSMKNIINQSEIVSFDCELFDMIQIVDKEIEITTNSQIMAIVINPLEDEDFEFCGYDLCDEIDSISAITNCGFGFIEAIDYTKLNKFGLIDKYEDAKESQKKLKEIYFEESHANFEIVKIWRKTKN